MEAPARDLEQEPRAGRAGVQVDPDRAAEQVHVARDRWIVSGRSTVRSHVVTAAATGCAAFFPQRSSRPDGDERRVGAEALDLVEDRRRAVAERGPVSPVRHGELDGRGEQRRLHGRQSGRRRHRREHRARAVGPAARSAGCSAPASRSGCPPGARPPCPPGRRSEPQPGAQAAIQPASSSRPRGFPLVPPPTPGPPKHVQPGPVDRRVERVRLGRRPPAPMR